MENQEKSDGSTNNFVFDVKDVFLVTAQPENGDKLAAIECWSIGSESCQTIRPFRNSFVAPGTLQFIGEQYVCGAAMRKPWISVWPLNMPVPVQPPLLTPATVSTFSVSPDGEYLVAALGNKLHVWQISTGEFLIILARHYQPVIGITFSSIGKYFASTSTDGVIFLWKTVDVVSGNECVPNPVTISCQSKVSAVIFGGSDIGFSYLICVGHDNCCRVYDSVNPSNGAIGTFVFRRPLVAVTTDECVTSIVVSDDTGNIFRIPVVTSDSRTAHPDIISETEWNQRYKFAGHSKPARCLQLSADGSLLISGSEDMTLRVWQVRSRVCIRVLTMKGPVSNLLRCKNPDILTSKINLTKLRPLLPLQKQLASEVNAGGKYFDVAIPVADLLHYQQMNSNSMGSSLHVKTASEIKCVDARNEERPERVKSKQEKSDLAKLLEEKDHEIMSLKSVNQELYEYARELVLNCNEVSP